MNEVIRTDNRKMIFYGYPYPTCSECGKQVWCRLETEYPQEAYADDDANTRGVGTIIDWINQHHEREFTFCQGRITRALTPVQLDLFTAHAGRDETDAS